MLTLQDSKIPYEYYLKAFPPFYKQFFELMSFDYFYLLKHNSDISQFPDLFKFYSSDFLRKLCVLVANILQLLTSFLASSVGIQLIPPLSSLCIINNATHILLLNARILFKQYFFHKITKYKYNIQK